MTSWHAQTAQSVLSQLNTSEKGLQADEVRRRGAQYGPNTLHVTPPPSWLIILIAQFRSVVVLLLFVAALAAWVLSDPLDAIAIAGVLVINTAIGFITELRARRAMEALRRLEVPRTTVMRDGRKIEINARELVPGDVVILEGGQSVPADARLTSATDLRVNEAPLTGESMPVEKRHDVVLDEQTVLAERSNMLYQATSLLSGAARAVVTATGSQTELGRIGAMTSALGEESTPLERRLDALGRRLVWVALGVALLVAAIGLLRGEAWSLVIQTAIALAIAAVPEGLPAVATITLAVGVWRMARRKALVRRLPVVETLGSATVVCADKTGTLTAGQMAVTTIVTADAVYAVSGGTYAPEGQFSRDDQLFNPLHDAVLAEALHVGALANHAEVLREDGTWRAVGDPTEAALLVAASKAGLDRETMRRQMPEAGEVPFSSERQWMATFHRTSDGLRAYVKGAPGRLI
ncbi:MAG TPA: HAD-IC family P-type ATPase, partial [Longimicrobiales bacterium]